MLPPQLKPEDQQIIEEEGEEDADEERKFVPGVQDYNYERRMSSPMLLDARHQQQYSYSIVDLKYPNNYFMSRQEPIIV